MNSTLLVVARLSTGNGQTLAGFEIPLGSPGTTSWDVPKAGKPFSDQKESCRSLDNLDKQAMVSSSDVLAVV